MSTTVWLGADTLGYPEGGGHLWVFLNWALGLRSAGCDVVWLECADPSLGVDEFGDRLARLEVQLARFGLADLAVCSTKRSLERAATAAGTVTLELARDADLLLNLAYDGVAPVIDRFDRRALVDIDPGLVQVWLSAGRWSVPDHDVYFTTSEGVGRSGSRIPETGVDWLETSPCVAVAEWPSSPTPDGAPFTTVSHWASSRQWFTQGDVSFSNSKRDGFQPFLDVPSCTDAQLELALSLGTDGSGWLTPGERRERDGLVRRGWRVVPAHEVAATAGDYRDYIRRSAGEFSCVKPSCVYLQNSWISDRTLCYLASGKPAVIQDTGPSRLLPDGDGVVRFSDAAGAVRGLEAVLEDYGHHAASARRLAEERFDATMVASGVLERVL